MRVPPLTSTGLPPGVLGRCPALLQIYAMARRVARTRLPVLVAGERGTGKEALARFVHDAGPRRPRPFVAVSCSTLTDSLVMAELFGHGPHAFTGASRVGQAGLLEQADGGTLMLDEVHSLSGRGQDALLRVLQEGRVRRVGEARERVVDVRVVAATNVSLAREVQAGRFRADLYDRLVVVRLALPPLRARGDDLEYIARALVQGDPELVAVPPARWTPAGFAALKAHGFPGNVRELQSVVRRVALKCWGREVTPEIVAQAIGDGLSVRSMDAGSPIGGGADIEGVVAQLLEADGSARAGRLAAALGCSRETARRRLAELVEAGRLRRVGQGRGVRYVSKSP